MSNSTNSIGIGINLSNIRASGASIMSSAPSGFSGLVSFDAASMYSGRMGTSSHDINAASWYSLTVYPFSVKRMNISELFSMGKDWFNARSFERRYDAEKYSLEQLCQWSDGDWEQDLRNKEKLKNFDDNHPEWLI